MRLADLEGRDTCTVEEAAQILGVSRPTAYRHAKSGELPSIRIGGRRLVPVAQLRRLLLGETPGGNADAAA